MATINWHNLNFINQTNEPHHEKEPYVKINNTAKWQTFETSRYESRLFEYGVLIVAIYSPTVLYTETKIKVRKTNCVFHSWDSFTTATPRNMKIRVSLEELCRRTIIYNMKNVAEIRKELQQPRKTKQWTGLKCSFAKGVANNRTIKSWLKNKTTPMCAQCICACMHGAAWCGVCARVCVHGV